MCGIMLVLRAVFNMFVKNASPRGPMCFRSMMFNLSGLCELLFLFYVIASWTCVVVSLMLCPCIFVCCYADVYVCLVCCVLNRVCELFGETIRNVFRCGYCFVAECYGCV